MIAKNVERPHEPLVKDDDLRPAYKYACENFGMAREKLIASTPAMELVKTQLGPKYGHVPLDWLRARIANCCKNPARHGGDWGDPNRPARHRPSKAHRFHGDVPGGAAWYEGYLQSPRFSALRERCFERDGRRCRVCNVGHSLEPHHRSYRFCGYEHDPDRELADLTTLCRVCHHHCHVCCDRLRQPH